MKNFSIASMLFCHPPRPALPKLNKAVSRPDSNVPNTRPLFSKGYINYPSGRFTWLSGQSEPIYYKGYIVDVYPEKGKWIYKIEVETHEGGVFEYLEESELREYK